MNLRNRRIDTEWHLLNDLADANSATLVAISRSEDEFRIDMRESPAWMGGKYKQQIEPAHLVRYVYPRYYPSLPLEGYFVRPICHINVDAVTGFICLWQDYRPAQTIVDAILITRAIMACKVANWDPAHRMQHDVATEHRELYELSMPALILPISCHGLLLHQRPDRRRLTSELDDQIPCGGNFALSDIE